MSQTEALDLLRKESLLQQTISAARLPSIRVQAERPCQEEDPAKIKKWNDRVTNKLLKFQEKHEGACVLVGLAKLKACIYPQIRLLSPQKYLDYMRITYSKLLLPDTLEIDHKKWDEVLLTMFPKEGIFIKRVTMNDEGGIVLRDSFPSGRVHIAKSVNSDSPIDTSKLPLPFAVITHQYLADNTHFITWTTRDPKSQERAVANKYLVREKYAYHPIATLEFASIVS